MSNRFIATNWSELVIFLVIWFVIIFGMYGLLWGGFEMLCFIYGLGRY